MAIIALVVAMSGSGPSLIVGQQKIAEIAQIAYDAVRRLERDGDERHAA